MTLEKVKEGLMRGETFMRVLDNDAGWEYLHLSPVNPSIFIHTMDGRTDGGWGGQMTFPLSLLNSGRWKPDGWVLREGF